MGRLEADTRHTHPVFSRIQTVDNVQYAQSVCIMQECTYVHMYVFHITQLRINIILYISMYVCGYENKHIRTYVCMYMSLCMYKH